MAAADNYVMAATIFGTLLGTAVGGGLGIVYMGLTWSTHPFMLFFSGIIGAASLGGVAGVTAAAYYNINDLCNVIGYRYKAMTGLQLEGSTATFTSQPTNDPRSAKDYCFQTRATWGAPNAVNIISSWETVTRDRQLRAATWKYTCTDMSGTFKATGTHSDDFLETPKYIQGRMCGTNGK